MLTQAIVAAGLPAQVRVDPARSAADHPAMTLEQALGRFRDGAGWADGFRGLLALAKGEQQAVLEAIAPLSRPGDDRDLTARSRILIQTIAMQHSAAEKREELRQSFRRVSDATSDLEQAVGAGAVDAQKKALAALRTAVATLDKHLQTEGPMSPTPLRVPVGGGPSPAGAPPQAPAGEPDLGGYREIEVNGKKMLVPADALPPGDDFEAEMTERGLVIKRKPKAGKPGEGGKPKEDVKKDDGKKKGDAKTGGAGDGV